MRLKLRLFLLRFKDLYPLIRNLFKHIIENLRPICGICNKSMGTTHMFEFMEQNGFKPLPK